MRSFVSLVSVCLFFPLPFFSKGGRKGCVCDDEDSVVLILHQRHLLIKKNKEIKKGMAFECNAFEIFEKKHMPKTKMFFSVSVNITSLLSGLYLFVYLFLVSLFFLVSFFYLTLHSNIITCLSFQFAAFSFGIKHQWTPELLSMTIWQMALRTALSKTYIGRDTSILGSLVLLH